MPTRAMRNVCQPVPSSVTSAAVASTTAAVSVPIRIARSTLRYRRGSARIACTADELPFEPSLARSLPPALTMRNRAISELAQSPAATASTTAAATSHAIAASPGFSTRLRIPLRRVPYRAALGTPGVEQLVLQAEHRGMFPGLGMVETEQVEYAVGTQHLQFVGDRAVCLAGLLGGNLRAQDDVAEHGGRPRVAAGGPGAVRPVAARGRRAQLVHGKGEDVRGTFLAHPALVQIGDGGTIHQQYRQLRQRVDPHLVEHVPGQRRQGRLVHADPGFVAYLDAHAPGPVTGPACGVPGALPGQRRARRPGHAGCRP